MEFNFCSNNILENIKNKPDIFCKNHPDLVVKHIACETNNPENLLDLLCI
jgi:hypothetical protein